MLQTRRHAIALKQPLITASMRGVQVRSLTTPGWNLLSTHLIGSGCLHTATSSSSPLVAPVDANAQAAIFDRCVQPFATKTVWMIRVQAAWQKPEDSNAIWQSMTDAHTLTYAQFNNDLSRASCHTDACTCRSVKRAQRDRAALLQGEEDPLMV